MYKTGSFTSAAGAAETISLGFKPDKVVVFNENASTGDKLKLDWFGSAQGQDRGFITKKIADNGSTSDFNTQRALTGGELISTTSSTPSITGELLSFSGEEGFIIDADFLDTNDKCWWEAWKSD